MCILQNEELYEKLYDDYLHHDNECSGNIGLLANNKCLLLDLQQRRFQEHGEDIMEACGFPLLPTTTDEISKIDRLRMKHDPEQQRVILETYFRLGRMIFFLKGSHTYSSKRPKKNYFLGTLFH